MTENTEGKVEFVLIPKEQNPETLCILKAQRKFHRPGGNMPIALLPKMGCRKCGAGILFNLSLEFSIACSKHTEGISADETTLWITFKLEMLCRNAQTFQQTSGSGQHPR